MKKKFIKTIAILCAMLMVCICFSGCSGSKKEIRNLLTEFEYACNTLDIDAMLNCINPEVSDKIRFAVGIAGMFANKDADELFEQVAGAIMGDYGVDGSDFFASIKITEDGIKVSKDSATVEAIVEYTVNGEHYEKNAVFNCVYYMEKWYISSFDLV